MYVETLVKKTVFEKTMTILDIHRAVYYSLLENTLSDILKDINGELDKRTYKDTLVKISFCINKVFSNNKIKE